jgi:hypothetical protein
MEILETEQGMCGMSRKTLFLLIIVGILIYGLMPVAKAYDSGLQSCMTYCRMNFDPFLKPSENAQCIERCKRDFEKRKSDWDRLDRIR